MKCLVFSDSHGYTEHMERALRLHPDAEVVFFLGDGLREVDDVAARHSDKFWVAVRGNCDFYPLFGDRAAEKTETVSLSGYTVTATHGDLFGAKYGCAELISLARKTGSDVVLFGHTHAPFTRYVSEYDKPFYLFNPGSISLSSGSFGVIMLGKNPLLSHGAII